MRGPTRLAVIASLALAAAFAAGCGNQDEPDVAHGKELFVGKGTCGSCHQLNRAGTKGQVGPNLDIAFGDARRDGLGEDTVEGVVYDQIANVRSNSAMPKDLLKGQDARDVAAYVALVAGQRGKDKGLLAKAGAPKVSNKPIVAKGGKLEMPADPTGALAFASKKASAPAGSLVLVSLNKSPIQHNIALKDKAGKILEEGKVVGTNGTSQAKGASLQAGDYEFLCTVPGHAAGGMRGVLSVK